MTSYPLSDESASLAFGATLGGLLRVGDVVALKGDLGAGKTTLVRGLVQGQLGAVDVPSPTYTLVQVYDMPDYELWHCDLYRLDAPEDVYELGLMEAMLDAVCIIEWPDKMGQLCPDEALKIDIEFTNDGGRIATLSGWEGRDV